MFSIVNMNVLQLVPEDSYDYATLSAFVLIKQAVYHFEVAHVHCVTIYATTAVTKIFFWLRHLFVFVISTSSIVKVTRYSRSLSSISM